MTNRTCRTCSGPMRKGDEGAAECYLCKWKARPRVPCTQCGGPTGYPIGSRDAATCQACRRSRFEHGTRKGYRDAKCRCGQCSEWNREQTSRYREGLRSKGIRLPGGSGPWISPKVRQAVFERDEWTCGLCGGEVDPTADPQSDWFPSLDHIVPKSKGGTHDVANLRTAHRWCNSIRGSEDYHAYLFEGVA